MPRNGNVVPGKQAVDLICAKGETGRKLLDEIANPANQPSSTRREDFGSWRNNRCSGFIVTSKKHSAFVVLRRDELIEEGRSALVIVDDPRAGFSMKPAVTNGHLALRLKPGVGQSRIRSLANQIVATFIIHGNGWTDRRAVVHQEPYGDPPTNGGKRKRNRERKRNRPHDRFRAQNNGH